MADPRDFDLWVEDDRIKVRFVTTKVLKRLASGHAVGGDYSDRIIRIFRGDSRRSQRGTFFHELGHYLCDRNEFNSKDCTEEEACDLLAWVPQILNDPRNDGLRTFLGVRT